MCIRDSYSSVDDALSAAASGRADVSYDSATATLTYTALVDGATMVPLNFQLPIVDDALIEGTEDYAVVLTNPTSTTGIAPALGAISSVTTNIEDTQGPGGADDGPAEWSITGPATADEGSTPQYTVTLAGLYQAGEVVTVDLGLTDTDTNSADYGSLITAVNTALAGNTDVVFNAATGTLTYTAPADGAAMTDIVIDLPLTDDALIEGVEDFSLDLTNPTSSTGLTVSVDAAAGSASTTISDTQGPGGNADGPGEWSVTGPASADEGSTPRYTASLSGAYGAGEDATVELALTDIDTTSGDYANFAAAVQAAVTAYAGDGSVAFDSGTGTITYTAINDGDQMDDLLIDLALIDDALIEGTENFSIDLANAGSGTGGDIAVSTTAASASTTINDTQGIGGASDGPAQWSITGSISGDEGDDAVYTVSLNGSFGAGEDATVDIDLSDIDTNSADYGNFVQSVQDAIDTYTGTGTVVFDQATGTITYTAGSDGDTMTDLVINLSLTDDALIEGPQDFTVSLDNSTSSTGAAIGIDTTASSVTSTINDTQGIGGLSDGPAEWSITGPAAGDEGQVAVYTIELDGAFGSGEDASVNVILTDIDTNSGDYADYLLAVQDAVTAYTGPGSVAFDGATGTITFTADNDGDVMELSLIHI